MQRSVREDLPDCLERSGVQCNDQSVQETPCQGVCRLLALLQQFIRISCGNPRASDCVQEPIRDPVQYDSSGGQLFWLFMNTYIVWDYLGNLYVGLIGIRSHGSTGINRVNRLNCRCPWVEAPLYQSPAVTR